MSDVRIEAIELPKDAVRFVKAWWPIYRDDEHWVPPLISERKQFFDPAQNPYFNVADVQCFMAYRGSAAVGTIAATVDHKYQEHHPGEAFFGFYEFIDDVEVARALLDAACDWLRERGMSKILGPFNFNSNHEFGCLIDGFDSPPYLLNPHNSAYYPAIYDQLGFTKAMDWYAYVVERKPVPPRMLRVTDRLLRSGNIVIRNVDMANYDREIDILRDIYVDAWSENWGHVELTPEEFTVLATNLKPLIDPRFVFVAEVDGVPAGLAISFPNYNEVVMKMNGRLLPFGWIHWVFGRKKIRRLRIFILGVKLEFQHLPLGAPLYVKTWESAYAAGMEGVEASLILETNNKMRSPLEKMGFHVHKTYRSYQLPLVEPEQPIEEDATPTLPDPDLGYDAAPTVRFNSSSPKAE